MSPQPLSSDASASPPREASDAELLRAIASGSEPAFEELRGRYRRAVERVCRAVAGSEREDCEQEVFARVWGKAALFDPGRGSAAVWLLTLRGAPLSTSWALVGRQRRSTRSRLGARSIRPMSMPSGWRRRSRDCPNTNGR